MKKEDEESKISLEDSTSELYFHKQIERELDVHHSYLGWKIYYYNVRFKPSLRYELIKRIKQRFQEWYPEERYKDELTLLCPWDHKYTVTVGFGEFVTPTQNEFSVEFSSQSFDWKPKQMRQHAVVGQSILRILKGKKEGYRMTTQRLVSVPVRMWKNSPDALLR